MNVPEDRREATRLLAENLVRMTLDGPRDSAEAAWMVDSVRASFEPSS